MSPMPVDRTEKMARLISVIAGVIALSILLLVPLIYFSTAVGNVVERVEFEVKIEARKFSQFIYANPETWIYRINYLDAFVTHHLSAQENARRLIFDDNNAILHEVSEKPAWPVLVRSAPLSDGFKDVGRIEIEESLRGIWIRTGFAAVLGLLLAAAVFVTLRVLPMRALRLTMADLKNAYDLMERRVESRTQELANKVNDLEKIEQTLEERETHLLAALSNMSSAILITDRNGIIRVINQNYRDFYSLVASDVVLGQSINTAFHTRAERGDFGSGDTDDLVRRHLPTSREGKPLSFIERLPDGRVLELFNSTTDDGGHVTIVNDITDRKRTEDELIQSGKLATLGRMSAGISHELSQPLNIIRLFADGALMDIDEGLFDSDGQRDILETVVQQTVRMAETINHMRVFSRRDQEGSLPFDPAVSVEDSVRLFSKQFEARDIELVSNLRTKEHLVKGATSRLEQVLLNLLSNAADSIAECANARNLDIADYPGKIEITVTNSADVNAVKISVCDNGIGVPDHVLPKVFDPFFTTKEVGEGTGLGLSISYAIIETMGGTISVDRLENGTCFEIELPCVAELEVAQPAQLVPQPENLNADGSPSLRLLLVDDEELARNSLARFLRRLGHKVETAGSGVEALEIYKPDTFDVVIADLQMPGMSGEKMIQEIRKITRDITVIVTTGKLLADGTHPYSDDPTIKVFIKPVSVGSIAKYLISLHDNTQNPA